MDGRDFAAVAHAAPIDIRYSLIPIKQSSTWSCWAAAAAILYSWKYSVPAPTEASMATMAEENAVGALKANKGLNRAELSDFLVHVHIATVAPQTPALDGWRQYLLKGVKAALQHAVFASGSSFSGRAEIFWHHAAEVSLNQH